MHYFFSFFLDLLPPSMPPARALNSLLFRGTTALFFLVVLLLAVSVASGTLLFAPLRFFFTAKAAAFFSAVELPPPRPYCFCKRRCSTEPCLKPNRADATRDTGAPAFFDFDFGLPSAPFALLSVSSGPPSTAPFRYIFTSSEIPAIRMEFLSSASSSSSSVCLRSIFSSCSITRLLCFAVLCSSRERKLESGFERVNSFTIFSAVFFAFAT
mmetsp:Transcript_26836/g.47497  ORF Transcript_26836/g.47497 Transcript_26836/m.47497 type:complete len:212 (-) Transcript_26836:500-1135(-)